MGLGVELDGTENLTPTGIPSQYRAARNESYQLRISKQHVDVLAKGVRKTIALIGTCVPIRMGNLHNARPEYYFHTELFQFWRALRGADCVFGYLVSELVQH